MMEWTSDCPQTHCVNLPAELYLVEVSTSLPESLVIGDDQCIRLHFETVATLPNLGWQGVPDLSALLE